MAGPAEHEAVEHLIRDLTQVCANFCLPPPKPETYNGRAPYPSLPFLDRMAGVPRGRFLDVGCGLGTKLFLLSALGWRDVTGLDHHRSYIEVARSLCPWAKFYLADAFEFPRYHEYDAVFMWWPCVDTQAELALEQHILERMRPGAAAYFPESPSGLEFRTV